MILRLSSSVIKAETEQAQFSLSILLKTKTSSYLLYYPTQKVISLTHLNITTLNQSTSEMQF